MPDGHARPSRVRRLRIWVALRILPRDWQAAGPAIKIHGPIDPAVLRRAMRKYER